MRTSRKLALVALVCLTLSLAPAARSGSLSFPAQATPREALVKGTIAARINFRLNSGLITVPVRVNGSRDLRMYLDTGMSAPVVLFFHQEVITELGLVATGQAQIGGAGGEERRPASLVSGATVEIGPLRMTGQNLIILSESRATSDWPVDGVIGKSLFDRYLAEIDYERSTVTLYEPAGAEVSAGAAVIPIDLAMGAPIIEGTIELEGGKTVPLRFAADIGHRSALSLNEDGQNGVLPPERTIMSIAGRGIQGEIAAAIGRIMSLKIGPFALREVPTAFLAPGTNPGFSRTVINGNIGSLVWRRFRVLLDYPAKKMFLVPNAGFDKPFPFNMAGLVLEQDREDVYFVRHVIEGTPASESEILEGDRLSAIEGKDVREYAYDALLDLFNAVGREVTLTISREGRILKKTLKLRRLI